MLVSFVPSNKETFHREKKADKLARSQEAKKPRSQEAKKPRRQLQESRILDPIFGA